jgi:glycosyltransferase involved in cell wall biosynthesis
MVSIIIPTYNRSKYLVEAVESCLNQSYTNIEIIIIDDGSTDGTEEMVSKLLNTKWENRNIIYIKQSNAGASAARNYGLENAKGDFIQYLDSDDILYPNKLQLQLAEMHKQNAEVCICYGFMGANLGAVENEILGESFENKIDLMHKMCSGRVHVMQTTAPIWRKTFLDDNYNNNRWNVSIAFGDDLEYHIRLLTKVAKICFVPQKLFFVREHSDLRLSNLNGNVKQIESGILTLQLVTSIIEKNRLWDGKFQQGILKSGRTLYFNYFKLADKAKLRVFEKWMLKIARKPKKRIFMIIIIFFRRIFGAKMLFNISDFFVKIKK